MDSEFSKYFTRRKAQPHYWYDLSVGSSDYHVGLTANTQKKYLGAKIYINDNKELFEKFKATKEAIENELWAKLEWHVADKACCMLIQGDIKGAPQK